MLLQKQEAEWVRGENKKEKVLQVSKDSILVALLQWTSGDSWHLSDPDLHLGGSSAMLTPRLLSLQVDSVAGLQWKEEQWSGGCSCCSAWRYLLRVGDIKTLETEAPRADFCGRIRGQTSMPSLNSPEQRQPESPTADSCTQNVGGRDAGRRASRGEGSLTLEAEQAIHVAPKRPCNFQLTNGGEGENQHVNHLSST